MPRYREASGDCLGVVLEVESCLDAVSNFQAWHPVRHHGFLRTEAMGHHLHSLRHPRCRSQHLLLLPVQFDRTDGSRSRTRHHLSGGAPHECSQQASVKGIRRRRLGPSVFSLLLRTGALFVQ